mmetsp:Transcript_9080/g.12069  ORF Transcript_9080/g.12069 Transcript_9080/m.12069 type:complete len:313 (+) Transcript_9080:165-1103(+)|eukprot:CAMPEP_0198137500 /NCGR_PEP_ID=MMETSP1443-20131203/979_1 /TAXON_ID=186043 /ORGANISM="Entomoneis sp., Strain CCMP2396" /LENGTH=312 /DNA_ID=CAMNT_0043798947 /DNA_START=107 /DNA_END=1045 /DNA_ORIENTATION=-
MQTKRALLLSALWLLCGCDAFQSTQVSGRHALAFQLMKGVPKQISNTGEFPGNNGLQTNSMINRGPSSGATHLFASSSSSPEGDSVDVEAITKYGVALATQVSLFYGFFTLLDTAVASTGFDVPFGVNVALFYIMSLRSRIFNPLSNKRPDVKTMEAEGAMKRNMPSWTPPGVVFPIMWILIIGPLRAVSSAMVYDVTQSYVDPAILAFAIHLSIGDVWNTINNVERRYGAAVSGVACVWLSKANTAYQYNQVSTTAGQLMSIPLVWLTVASALVASTWQLNPDEQTGEVDPLYPVAGKASTEFAWFKNAEE